MSERTSFRERLSRNKYRLVAGVLAGLALASCSDGHDRAEARGPAPTTTSAEALPQPAYAPISEVPEPAAEAGPETDTRNPEQITEDVEQASVELARNIVAQLANSNETEVDAASDTISTMSNDDVLRGSEYSATYSEGGEAPEGVVGQAIFEASVPADRALRKVDRLIIALDVKEGSPLAQSGENFSTDLLEEALKDPDTLQMSMLSPLSYTDAEIGSQQFGLAYNARERKMVDINGSEGSGQTVNGQYADEINNLAHTIMNRIDPTYPIPERPER